MSYHMSYVYVLDVCVYVYVLNVCAHVCKQAWENPLMFASRVNYVHMPWTYREESEEERESQNWEN